MAHYPTLLIAIIGGRRSGKSSLILRSDEKPATLPNERPADISEPTEQTLKRNDSDMRVTFIEAYSTAPDGYWREETDFRRLQDYVDRTHNRRLDGIIVMHHIVKDIAPCFSTRSHDILCKLLRSDDLKRLFVVTSMYDTDRVTAREREGQLTASDWFYLDAVNKGAQVFIYDNTIRRAQHIMRAMLQIIQPAPPLPVSSDEILKTEEFQYALEKAVGERTRGLEAKLEGLMNDLREARLAREVDEQVRDNDMKMRTQWQNVGLRGEVDRLKERLRQLEDRVVQVEALGEQRKQQRLQDTRSIERRIADLEASQSNTAKGLHKTWAER